MRAASTIQRNHNMQPLTRETVYEAIVRATMNPSYRNLHAVKDLGQVVRRLKIRIPTSDATEYLLCLIENLQTVRSTASESLYTTLLRTLLAHSGTRGPTRALVQLMRELKGFLSRSSDPTFINGLLKLTLARGAKVNGPSSVVRSGFTHIPTWAVTPLHIAAEYGDAETVRLLVNRGASVNARTRHEIYRGGEYINSATVYAEPPTGVGRTPLHVAIRVMNVPTIKALLRAKSVNVNATDPMGATPLHLAVIYGFFKNEPMQHAPDVVEMLMKAGANPFKKMEIPDEFGDTFPHTVIELFNIPRIRVPGAVRDMIMVSSRAVARKHLNATLPNDLVQTILHRAGVTSVSEYNPSMPDQIRLDRLALKNMQAKRKRAGGKVAGVKRSPVITRSQTRQKRPRP